MQIIVCFYNMFAAIQTIHIISEKGNQKLAITSGSIAYNIPQLCDEYNISQVQLYGNVDFLQPIAEEIQATNLTKYNRKNIKVEVIPNG